MDWGGSVGRRSRLLMNTPGLDLVAVNNLGAPTNVGYSSQLVHEDLRIAGEMDRPIATE